MTQGGYFSIGSMSGGRLPVDRTQYCAVLRLTATLTLSLIHISEPTRPY